MTNRYKVDMIVEGETINEVASKLMVSAYTQEFEIQDLKIEQLGSDPEWLTEEGDLGTFEFPHVKMLIDGLTEKRKRDANR